MRHIRTAERHDAADRDAVELGRDCADIILAQNDAENMEKCVRRADGAAEHAVQLLQHRADNAVDLRQLLCLLQAPAPIGLLRTLVQPLAQTGLLQKMIERQHHLARILRGAQTAPQG